MGQRIGPNFKISLFGAVRIEANGQALCGFRSQKTLQLLALLVLRHGREVERHWLAGTLWPDSNEAHSHAALRVTLFDLRKSLGDGAWRIRSIGKRAVSIDLKGAECDVVSIDEAIQEGRIDETVDQCQGNLLEGWYEDWVLSERSLREERILELLETVAEKAAGEGDFARCEHVAGKVLGFDPLREPIVRLRMAALAAQGRTAEACQLYRAFRDQLVREVGCEPAEETRALDRKCRAHCSSISEGTHISVGASGASKVDNAIDDVRTWVASSKSAPEVLDLRLRYVADLAARGRSELSGPRQREWVKLLQDDHQLIRLGLAWASTGGQDANGDERLRQGAQICTFLGRFWTHAGLLEEGFQWFRLFAAERTLAQWEGRSELLSFYGKVAEELGHYDQARTIQMEALAFATAKGDDSLAGLALLRLAILAIECNDPSSAKSLACQSLRIAEGVGDLSRQDDCHTVLGLCEAKHGNWTRAWTHLERSLSIEKELGDVAGIGTGINNLGLLSRMQGQVNRAQTFHRKALQVSYSVGHFSEVEEELEAIGFVFCHSSRLKEAVQLWGAAAAIRDELKVHRHRCGREGIDQTILGARETLRLRSFDQCYRQGWEMGPEAACTLALGAGPSDAPALGDMHL